MNYKRKSMLLLIGGTACLSLGFLVGTQFKSHMLYHKHGEVVAILSIKKCPACGGQMEIDNSIVLSNELGYCTECYYQYELDTATGEKKEYFN